MPKPHVHGLHHVTCIAGDPQENLDFYTKVLGMRLVKKSINQDAPDTYHLFYADAAGSPGTDLTFFPWPDAAPGRPGVGLTNEVMLAVPAGTLPWWRVRLDEAKVRRGEEVTRFGEKTLPFTDPHGLELALVEIAEDRAFAAWDRSPVPADKQIRGFHAVRLWERDPAPTIRLLVDVMGLAPVGNDEGWQRFGIGGRSGTLIDVKAFPDERRGAWGLGSVHHIAWRVTDTPEEMAVRGNVEGAGLHPTPQIDRFWFQSVYFKEPGGALFELATDGPGFARDEDPAHLGETLVLPPWYEPRRAEIEAGLPALRA
ncbi:MAG TPA: ring-cleaving dioxygenase [Gemmatimonadales bacterium]|nr:ring-cleaving dioxygenase [Gemmatimonadales bacterium]